MYSGIGKGVIGASPPQSPISSPIPSSHKPSTRVLPPHSAHQPHSTIHTPLPLSRAISRRNSRSTSLIASKQPSVVPSVTATPQSLPSLTDDTHETHETGDANNDGGLATPNTLFSILTSVLNTSSELPNLLDAPMSPTSVWSFLTDPDYVHPLLAQPLPPSCHSIASSTGLLLKTAGLKVTAIKIDPYMNIDAGTMAPTEHG